MGSTSVRGPVALAHGCVFSPSVWGRMWPSQAICLISFSSLSLQGDAVESSGSILSEIRLLAIALAA